MAVDYSTLSDEELKAIANNDYSKLSDATLRAIANEPKSQQQRPVEGAGGAAFGVYRPQGRRPESQQDREAAKEMAPQTLRGLFTGGLGMPSDILNLPGTIYSAASGQPAPYQVPYGSEQWNQMLPGRIDTPHANLGRFGGEVLAPVPSIKALKTIPGAVSNVGDVVSGAVGTGTGYIARPGRTPRGYQQPSQRNPIGSTYTPPEEFAKFERGELPYGQMPEQRPISELPQGRLDRAAMMLSGGNIPNAGQGARAFGERLGETYRNPLTAAADVGSMFFTGGIPVLTTLRGGLAGAQALADMRLANKGFTPELPKILEEYQTGVRPMPGVQPGPMPRGFQAAGPISPGGLAQPTPAAQAAMATTQRVAKTPAAPKPQPQPFTLPDAGTHYAAAEQGSANFADTFNKAVAARTQDLLKNARQTGQALTPEQAGNLAFDEIKEFRRNNVEAFKPAPEPTGPVAPAATPEEAVAQFNPPKVDPELQMDQGIWKRLQDKTAAGTPLEVNEQTAVRRITNKYGQDPFQTGDLKGSSVLEAVDVADGFQVRAGMKQSAKAGITTKNGKIQIDEAVFNDAAKSLGMPEIDFKSMPDLKGLSLAEARKAVETEINRQYKTAGAYGKTTRGPNQSTLVKQANAGKTPEELKAQDLAAVARMDKLNEFLKTGKIGTGTAKPTTPEVAGPVRPEGAVDTPKMTNAELLELIKARSNKGKAPPGTMSMMTGKPNDVMGNVMMGKLKGNFDEFPTGSYTENGIRHEIIDNPDYTRMTDVLKEMVPNMPKKAYRQVDVKTGKVIEGAKSTKELEDVAEKMLKKAQEGKKKQGK